ncbi:MAG TPA: hypothetical protein VM576_12620 [Xanthomonadaceae bacterium]|nr:hypothetical protein [Xanthomonadaceae bacterium]
MLIHLHQPSAVQLLDETRTRARILGEEATQHYPDQPWNAVERHLAGEWLMMRGNSPLDWTDVRHDAHAAWQAATLECATRSCDDFPVFDRAA